MISSQSVPLLAILASSLTLTYISFSKLIGTCHNITNTSKYQHNTPKLKKQHWLLIKRRQKQSFRIPRHEIYQNQLYNIVGTYQNGYMSIFRKFVIPTWEIRLNKFEISFTSFVRNVGETNLRNIGRLPPKLGRNRQG